MHTYKYTIKVCFLKKKRVQYATIAVCCFGFHGFHFFNASAETLSFISFYLNNVKRKIVSLLVYKWPLLLQITVTDVYWQIIFKKQVIPL